MELIVAPSMLACDFSRLGEDFAAAEGAGADWHHCDVMDGHFVPNISFGVPVIASAAAVATKPLDVHLMITEPSRYIEPFAKAGAARITVHIETIGTTDAAQSVEEIASVIRSHGCKVGLAVSPDTPVEAILPHLGAVDMALVMTVYPGFGGQAFLANMLPKFTAIAREAEAQGLTDYLIQADGGVNADTVGPALEAGANVLVAGSYIYGQPRDRYRDPIDSMRSEWQRVRAGAPRAEEAGRSN